MNRAVPTKIPAMVTTPSQRPDAAETTEVPGQSPLMMKPMPRRNPPTTWAHMKVGFTHIRAMSTQPIPTRV